MTREEFWASPLGIIFIGLIVGVIVILCIRGLIKLARGSSKKGPRYAPPPAGAPRAQSMNFPER